MMGCVSPETCWVSYKYGIIKLLIHCCILLDFSLWIVLWCTDPRISSSELWVVQIMHRCVFCLQPEDGSGEFCRKIRNNSRHNTFLCIVTSGLTLPGYICNIIDWYALVSGKWVHCPSIGAPIVVKRRAKLPRCHQLWLIDWSHQQMYCRSDRHKCISGLLCINGFGLPWTQLPLVALHHPWIILNRLPVPTSY